MTVKGFKYEKKDNTRSKKYPKYTWGRRALCSIDPVIPACLFTPNRMTIRNTEDYLVNETQKVCIKKRLAWASSVAPSQCERVKKS